MGNIKMGKVAEDRLIPNVDIRVKMDLDRMFRVPEPFLGNDEQAQFTYPNYDKIIKMEGTENVLPGYFENYDHTSVDETHINYVLDRLPETVEEGQIYVFTTEEDKERLRNYVVFAYVYIAGEDVSSSTIIIYSTSDATLNIGGDSNPTYSISDPDYLTAEYTVPMSYIFDQDTALGLTFNLSARALSEGGLYASTSSVMYVYLPEMDGSGNPVIDEHGKFNFLAMKVEETGAEIPGPTILKDGKCFVLYSNK